MEFANCYSIRSACIILSDHHNNKAEKNYWSKIWASLGEWQCCCFMLWCLAVPAHPEVVGDCSCSVVAWLRLCISTVAILMFQYSAAWTKLIFIMQHAGMCLYKLSLPLWQSHFGRLARNVKVHSLQKTSSTAIAQYKVSRLSIEQPLLLYS